MEFNEKDSILLHPLFIHIYNQFGVYRVDL